MSVTLLALPKAWGLRNEAERRDRRSLFRSVLMALLGFAFWLGTFFLFYRVLAYFRSTEAIGDLLAYRLLEMTFVTFFSVLLFSGAITALSTLYISEEMQLILSAPVPRQDIYVYKYAETCALSSWMVVIFGLPVFLSYGLVYHSGAIFFPAALVVLFFFIFIPVPLGMAVSMLLVRIFPAKRTRDILFFLSLVVLVVVYFLIRFIQPERLLNPEEFREVAGYIASLKAPSNPYLPSSWAARSLWPLITGKGRFDVFWPGMLASTSAAFFILCGWLFAWIFDKGYSRAQEGGRYRTYGLSISGGVLDALASPLSNPARAILVKDARTFLRDTAQWSQLLLLSAIVVVYIYNFRVLPIKNFPFATFYLENLISFLNLGLTAFVAAAVAVRMVFPLVSLERQSFWIIKASPVGLKGFLWSKFWSAWFPLMALSEAILLVSNHYLKAGAFMAALSASAVFLFSFGITGLAVGLGAVYPKFRYENPAQIPAGFGGVVFMLVTMGYISFVVALLAWPVYVFLTSRLNNIPMTQGDAWLTLVCLAAAVGINVAAFVVPMRKGLDNIESLEL